MADVQLVEISATEGAQIINSTVEAQQPAQIVLAVPGVQGPTGSNLPASGTTHQVLFKQSNTNYDTGWKLITNDNVDGAAAIAGTKISPNFGSQTIQTTGVFSHALGTAGAPSITFTGDVNTGIYSPGADQVAISTAGTGRLFVTSDGNVGIGLAPPSFDFHLEKDENAITTSYFRNINTGASAGSRLIAASLVGNLSLQAYSAAHSVWPATTVISSDSGFTGGLVISATGTNPLRLFTDSSERLRLDPSGRLLVGTSTVIGDAFAGANGVRSLITAGTSASIGTHRNGDDSFGNAYIFTKARGTAVQAVIANDTLGLISFQGANGSAFNFAAEIRCEVDGTPGLNDMPGRLVFSTTADGAASPTERLRITSAGLVGIGTSAPAYALTVSTASPTFDRVAQLISGTANSFLGFGTSSGAGELAPEIGATGSDVVINTQNTERLRVAAAGNVGIGTTSPDKALVVETSSGDAEIAINAQAGGSQSSILRFRVGGTTNALIQTLSSNLLFYSGTTERARIDSSGRLLVGTSTSRSTAFGQGSVQVETASRLFSLTSTANDQYGGSVVLAKTRGTAFEAVTANDTLGIYSFHGADGVQMREAARIQADVDGTVTGGGAADMPGRLVFSTTADGASSPTERMRIDNVGDVMIGVTFATPGSANTSTGIGLNKNGAIFASRSSSVVATINRNTSDGDSVSFRRDGSQVGAIYVTTAATSYNTSSDYRLKKNVTPVTDGITRLQQLKPSRFNFIADPDKTVDGFLAHEVQAIVPEAITGEKDAVDDEGNPQYQGIDQSKLVPLLTAALQEAVAEINALKDRLTAAGL